MAAKKRLKIIDLKPVELNAKFIQSLQDLARKQEEEKRQRHIDDMKACTCCPVHRHRWDRYA